MLKEDWKFPPIDKDMNKKCPNVRFYKGKNLCIVFKKICTGWKLNCALRGMKVNLKLYNLWKSKGWIK